ncbi:MAG: hypothetical protein Q7T30_04690, partial [Planctomycetota bacterium]|nr:hypothetical protein [Planctomycetota bacterium]
SAPPAPTGPMPAPAAFDGAGLAWTAEDALERVAAARRLCARGEYEQALAVLPADGAADADPAGLTSRERVRVAATIALRDAVLLDSERNKTVIAVRVDGKEVRGRVVRRDGESIVLLVGTTERTVPCGAMTILTLQREGTRLRRFEGNDRWLEVWVRWLQGQSLATLGAILAVDNATMRALRADLPKTVDPTAGTAGEGLWQLQNLKLAEPRPDALRQLQIVQSILKANRTAPQFVARRPTIDALVGAVAERAFDPTDETQYGLDGKVSRLADGRICVEYSRPREVASLDCTLEKLRDPPFSTPKEKIEHAGPDGFVALDPIWQWVGSGYTTWAVPLRGHQTVEFDFTITGFGYWHVLLCSEGNAALAVALSGVVTVLDPATGINGDVGTSKVVAEGERTRFHIDFDGESKLEVRQGVETTAKVTEVGTRRRGALRFCVHASPGANIANMRITGMPDLSDPTPLRQRYVSRVIAEAWR